MMTTEDQIHGLPAGSFREQFWQTPARMASERGFSDGDSAIIGELMVDSGLVTEQCILDYLTRHPEHAPQV